MIEHTPNLTTQSTWIRSSLRQPPRNRPTFENQDQNPKPYFSHSLHLEPQKRHAKAIKLFKNETPEKNKEREEKSNSKEGLKPPLPKSTTAEATDLQEQRFQRKSNLGFMDLFQSSQL